ncbi:hypothetical protein PAECIP112173_02538 [Paenibacillus sp. JJ-100]|nr:hypothetical protein PAECIP112173_02538 [Paenibacillus sp. JJ-100]
MTLGYDLIPGHKRSNSIAYLAHRLFGLIRST